MTAGRVLGLDPGEVRVGVALSDPSGIIAQPLVVLDRRHGSVVPQIADIVAEQGVACVVIGLPVSLGGEEGVAAQRARALGVEVEKEIGCEVTFFDERFTTVQAEHALLGGRVRRRERRSVVDKVAAAIMLQGYLDAQRRDES
jgi:putative Holliday junction resolvase